MALTESVKPFTVKALNILKEQWEHWEKEQEAQAGIVAINYVLDGLTHD